MCLITKATRERVKPPQRQRGANNQRDSCVTPPCGENTLSPSVGAGREARDICCVSRQSMPTMGVRQLDLNWQSKRKNESLRSNRHTRCGCRPVGSNLSGRLRASCQLDKQRPRQEQKSAATKGPVRTPLSYHTPSRQRLCVEQSHHQAVCSATAV